MGYFSSTSSVTGDVIRLRHLFVNMYLYGSGREWVLIDAGLPGSYNHIAHAAEKYFGKDVPPKAVILTHGHFDHVGALKKFLSQWNVPVYAHRLELPYLTGKQSYPPAEPRVGNGLMARSSFLFPNEPIDLSGSVYALDESGEVPFMPGWRWLHTPGHAPGHISLFRQTDRCLIAGDAVVTTKQESFLNVAVQKSGIFGPPSYFTPDWVAARESVEKLALLQPEIAATGHGRILSGPELKTGLKELADNFDRLALPKKGRYVPSTGSTHTKYDTVAAGEARWLHERMDRSNEHRGIPDVAMAPLGTDQEAGGAISTPSGERKYN